MLKDGRSDLARKKWRDQRRDQEETFVLLSESFCYTQMIFPPSLLFSLRCLNQLSVKSLIRFFSFLWKLWRVWTGTVTWPYSPLKPPILLFPLTGTFSYYFFATRTTPRPRPRSSSSSLPGGHSDSLLPPEAAGGVVQKSPPQLAYWCSENLKTSYKFFGKRQHCTNKSISYPW